MVTFISTLSHAERHMERIIEFVTQEWSMDYLTFFMNRKKFQLPTSEFPKEVKELLAYHLFDPTSQFVGSIVLKRGQLDYSTIKLERIKGNDPIQLSSYQVVQTEYVRYNYGTYTLNVQRNGFMVYCAPTGQGKTYFALSNITSLSKQCDTLLYINLELSVDDIYNRCMKMGLQIPKNLYVAPFEQVSLIETWGKNLGKVIIIVDNIDNLVGGGNDPFGEQLEFIKRLDRWLKDNNNHALVLTQLVKDSNMALFGKDGYINPSLNTNILSGVKQLSYLSRTVLMTAYSDELATYDYKILKMGSAYYD